MTPLPQRCYICNDDDLGCLHDYLVAAINGEDLSELPRLWNQEIGVIRSRFIGCTSHSSAPSTPQCLCDACTMTVEQCRGKHPEQEIREKVIQKFVDLIIQEMVYDDGDMYYKVNPDKYVELLSELWKDEREKVLEMINEIENWIQRGYSRRGVYEEEMITKIREAQVELRSKERCRNE
jgi:hypothetical protein